MSEQADTNDQIRELQAQLEALRLNAGHQEEQRRQQEEQRQQEQRENRELRDMMRQVMSAAQLSMRATENAQAAATPSPAVATAPTEPTTRAERPRKTLPELSLFSGERGDYLVWALEARSKMRFDAAAIGDHGHQYAYLFARMGPKAQKLVASYYEEHSADPDPATFLVHLDHIFIDPNAASRALSKLSTLQQGHKESFAAFLPRFERVLHEAQLGPDANDRVARSYLRNALSTSLKEAMVGPVVHRTYAEYVHALGVVSSQLEEIWHSAGRAPARRTPFGAPPTTTTTTTTRPAAGAAATPRVHSDVMEWEPTAARAAKLVPLTPELRAELMRVGACFRCRQTGHLSRNCPGGRPTTTARPAAIAETTDEPASENEDLLA